MNNDTAKAIKAALMWLEAWDFKTLDYFLRVLMGWVSDLHRGEVQEADFVDRLADLIQQQLTRAWNEGMRANGLDPLKDMTPEYQAILNDIIASEYQYVDKFAADIVAGRAGDVAPFQQRAQLWANRYNDVVNQAKIETAELKDKFEWVYGDAEHCDTCAALNGLVATAKEWEISGLKPQHPPNDMLSCGGWKCKCELIPTEKRRSPKVLDTLLTIGAR